MVTGQILADARWVGPHGIGRFAREVLSRIPGVVQLKDGPKRLSVIDPAWLSYQIVKRQPAVFFSPGFNAPAVCPVPLVITIHDLIQLELPEYATWKRRFYYHFFVRRASSRAFKVLTGSEYSRGEVLKWTGLPDDGVVNVSYGVDSTFQPEGDRHDPGFPYILYVGNHRPHKNLDRLFQAFRQINFPELHLILTGTRSAEMEHRLRQYDICQRVQFAGLVRDEELPPLYRGARFLIMPSLMEGFGLPALEALACGTAVIASKATALPEVVGDAALLVDPLNVCDIRQAMERVLSDSELRQSMQKAGPPRARRFSWDHVAEKVRTVLEGAAG